MEKLTKYSQIIVDFLEEYSKVSYPNAPTLEQQVIVDTKRNHFELVSVGWHKEQFIHEVVFHFDIKDNKIIIQQNWTDIKISQELVRRGVEADDIKVGFVYAYA
ncbi:MAG: XisI protein [Emticicia sp.]|nr:XisI protein [Emticicia sp.]